MTKSITLKKALSLFFFPSSEVFPKELGLKKTWDLTSYGSEVKKKIKSLWQDFFITFVPNVFSWDSSILTNEKVWKLSGHVDSFFDWIVICSFCQKKNRLPEEIKKDLLELEEKISDSTKTNSFYSSINFPCWNCGKKTFHGLSKQSGLLSLSKSEEKSIKEKDRYEPILKSSSVYLRPETCQGIYLSFLHAKRTLRCSLPFGLGQIGKSFRREATLNHGIFRTSEFEQMELEFFCREEEKDFYWSFWMKKVESFIRKILNEYNCEQKVKNQDLLTEERPHYSKKTTDFFFLYNFGWGELCSNSDRGNFDLHNFFPENKECQETNILEFSFGVERIMLASLENAYTYCSKTNREFLRLSPLLSPFFCCVVSLSDKLFPLAEEIYLLLLKKNFPFSCDLEKGSVGKSYYHQDLIGTFFCLTVDYQTELDQTITIRFRDTREQKRIKIEELESFLLEEYGKQRKIFFDQ